MLKTTMNGYAWSSSMEIHWSGCELNSSSLSSGTLVPRKVTSCWTSTFVSSSSMGRVLISPAFMPLMKMGR